MRRESAVACGVLAAASLITSTTICILAWFGLYRLFSGAVYAPLGFICVGLMFFTLPSRAPARHADWAKGYASRFRRWAVIPVIVFAAFGYATGMSAMLSAPQDGYVSQVGGRWVMTRDRDGTDIVRDLTPEEVRASERSAAVGPAGIFTVFYSIQAGICLVWLLPPKTPDRKRRA